MNRSEAYSKLEIDPTASDDEVKKKFRELSKKLHPDKNPGNKDAEAKFKEINEAYQRIINPGPREINEDQFSDGTGGIGFDFSGFGFSGGGNVQRFRHSEHIQCSTNISFIESILGCKKEIKYTRDIKCNTCNGQGKFKLNTGCKKCGGSGHVMIQQRGMIMVQPCDLCFGKAQSKKCDVCSDGIIKSESSVNVTIPGGVHDQNALRLNQMGNFVGNLGHIDQYTDAFLVLNVEKDKDMRLEDEFVISDLNITLLDAIKGCTKVIRTVIGDKDIKIDPLSRNKEEVIIPNAGINKIGSHKVILNVSYPVDVEPLIKALE
jgi:molecular chaperone DnaJ